MSKPIVAIMYDFDHTLSPGNMQEYAFVPGIGMNSDVFWYKCNELASKNNMDPILAYMYLMKEESEGKMLLTRDIFRELGKSVKLFDGVSSWFKRVNTHASKYDLDIEHYIISSGLKEIIEGTKIAEEFKEIYAAEFYYNKKQVPVWPAIAVNYTSKTQFLYRINKGVLDVNEHKGLNEYTPENKRRIPFENMIYIGDGLTDVPCMKLCKANGGHSIAVYQNDNRKTADDMLKQERVDFAVPADYSKDSKMETTVFAIIDQIKAYNTTMKLHLSDMDAANEFCHN
ncbi:MAG: HAD family hydrolase [Eubacteriales bacterium]|nr:HAD family hydrolase [Eubacteriales bacterium]MDD4476300.1 HAD family hydrolase [Eubacteriales bacterium]